MRPRHSFKVSHSPFHPPLLPNSFKQLKNTHLKCHSSIYHTDGHFTFAHFLNLLLLAPAHYHDPPRNEFEKLTKKIRKFFSNCTKYIIFRSSYLRRVLNIDKVAKPRSFEILEAEIRRGYKTTNILDASVRITTLNGANGLKFSENYQKLEVKSAVLDDEVEESEELQMLMCFRNMMKESMQKLERLLNSTDLFWDEVDSLNFEKIWNLYEYSISQDPIIMKKLKSTDFENLITLLAQYSRNIEGESFAEIETMIDPKPFSPIPSTCKFFGVPVDLRTPARVISHYRKLCDDFIGLEVYPPLSLLGSVIKHLALRDYEDSISFLTNFSTSFSKRNRNSSTTADNVSQISRKILDTKLFAKLISKMSKHSSLPNSARVENCKKLYLYGKGRNILVPGPLLIALCNFGEMKDLEWFCDQITADETKLVNKSNYARGTVVWKLHKELYGRKFGGDSKQLVLDLNTGNDCVIKKILDFKSKLKRIVETKTNLDLKISTLPSEYVPFQTDVFIKSLVNSNQVTEAVRLYNLIPNSEKTIHCHNIMLDTFIRLGLLPSAIKLYNEIPRDAVSLNTLLNGMKKLPREFNETVFVGVYKALKSRPVRTDTLRIIIGGLLDFYRIEAVEEILTSNMLKDKYILTRVMKYIPTDEARAVFIEMLKQNHFTNTNNFETGESLGLDKYSLSCGKSKYQEMKEIDEFLNKLRIRHLGRRFYIPTDTPLTPPQFNRLIVRMLKKGQHAAVRNLFLETKKKSPQSIDVLVYQNMIIEEINSGNPRIAFQWYEECLDYCSGVDWDFVNFVPEGKLTETATAYPDYIFLKTVYRAFCRKLCYTEAIRVFCDMRKFLIIHPTGCNQNSIPTNYRFKTKSEFPPIQVDYGKILPTTTIISPHLPFKSRRCMGFEKLLSFERIDYLILADKIISGVYEQRNVPDIPKELWERIRAEKLSMGSAVDVERDDFFKLEREVAERKAWARWSDNQAFKVGDWVKLLSVISHFDGVWDKELFYRMKDLLEKVDGMIYHSVSRQQQIMK